MKDQNPMQAVSFKVEKMFVTPDCGSLKAFCDISVNEAIIIKGVKILDGKKGIFISMPVELGKDRKWTDIVVCKSQIVYEDFSNTVIDEYRKTMEGI